jgi:hypothetical protein
MRAEKKHLHSMMFPKSTLWAERKEKSSILFQNLL